MGSGTIAIAFACRLDKKSGLKNEGSDWTNGLVAHIDNIENKNGEYNFPQDFFQAPMHTGLGHYNGVSYQLGEFYCNWEDK